MADTDKEYRIKITTTADMQGATSALDKLGDVSKSVSGTQYDLGEDIGKVEKRIEGVSGQSREFYRIMSELDRFAPGLGESLRAIFEGPLASIGLLIFGATELKGVLEKYQEKLDDILGEDLTQGIDKANALAQAFTGIADAVRKANDEFNSAASIYERARAGIQDQLALTKQLIESQKELALQRLADLKQSGQISGPEYEARRQAVENQGRAATQAAEERAKQAELAQKINEAANAQAQADEAKRRAQAFHLPESDEVAKAQSQTLSKQAAEQQKIADDARKQAAILNDMVTEMHTSGFLTGLGVNATSHPIELLKTFFTSGAGNDYLSALFFPSILKGAAAGKGREATEAAGNALGLDRAAAERDQAIKDRDAARAAAERLAGEATKAHQDAALAIKAQSQVVEKMAVTLQMISNLGPDWKNLNDKIDRVQQQLASHSSSGYR